MSRRSSIITNSINKTIADIKYKVTRKLGEGMFSTVKLATHSLTGEKVAIKILEKTRISKVEDKERINREMEIMKKLHHFNIVKLYQIVENKLTIYLIHEYVEGKEFMEYLTKKGKLKENEACKFYHQIISGLEYLHQCGIAHRDFKPENILINNDNTILKIIDFGLSNTYKNNQLLKTACGSPCYAPPEMIQEQSYNGALSDIWSSGIILYLMLCGNLPFYHEENEIMYQKILSGKFELPKFLSDNAKDILKKILEVDPKKRMNFEEIKAHPWFNIIDKNCFMHKGINVNEDIMPIDEDIITKMEKIGFNKMEVKYSLIKNFHNKVTTVYDLFLKQKIDNGNKSIGDMNSDLFDEYINDKKNKIKFYGSLESTLKNRICEGNKKISILPNYFEDKYDENNDDIIVGDTGSVIERLIKAGRFTYDEENMCLNKVTNSNKPSKKENKKDNDGDSKFKTITAISTKPKKIQKKNTEEKSNNVKIDINKNKSKKESQTIPIKKSKNIFKSTPMKKSDKNLKKKVSRKNDDSDSDDDSDNDSDNDNDDVSSDESDNGDDNDWYKEIEAMITKDNKKSKRKDNETKNYKKKKSSSVNERKIKDEEIELDSSNNEKSNTNKLLNSNKKTKKMPKILVKKNDKNKAKLHESIKPNHNVLFIKPSKTKSETNSKSKSILITKLNTQNDIAKNGKINNKKIDDLNDYFNKNKVPNNHIDDKSSRTTKFIKVVKKDGKYEKKKLNKSVMSESNNGRKGQSCSKRNNKIKI